MHFVVQVNLLDAKKSLNVNIFLRQFHVTHCELVEYLRAALPGQRTSFKQDSGCSADPVEMMGVERLRGLHKVLPEPDEVDMLKSYSGDVTRLGNAEKFYMELIKLPE